MTDRTPNHREEAADEFERLRGHNASEALLKSLGSYFEEVFASEYDRFREEMPDARVPEETGQEDPGRDPQTRARGKGRPRQKKVRGHSGESLYLCPGRLSDSHRPLRAAGFGAAGKGLRTLYRAE